MDDNLEDDYPAIIIEFGDGTTAIWGSMNPNVVDRIAAILEQELGQPDTLKC